MYRIVISDDQLHSRKGLSLSIDWKSLGFSLVGSFEDGSDVIAYMKKHPVDVVFTDIEMPEVSGIELAKWVSENYPEVIVVFISGRQEFEYARKALETGVFSYVLKPINPLEIEQVFTKVKEKLDRRPEKVRNIEDLCEEDREQILAADNLVDKTKSYIRKHIKQDFGLDEIAEYLHVSRSYLVKYFKKYSGETVMEYVLKIKMEHVLSLMKKGVFSPEVLAAEVGYHDVRYFQRVFKKYTGYSIKEYDRLLH